MTSAESDPVESDDPFTVVYAELRRIAAGCLADENRAHTLSPTALVHEAWLRLQRSGPERFAGIRSMKALAAIANATWIGGGHKPRLTSSASG
mgnify:CR=1 FL=1